MKGKRKPNMEGRGGKRKRIGNAVGGAEEGTGGERRNGEGGGKKKMESPPRRRASPRLYVISAGVIQFAPHL